jgi:hypothetical protein
VIFADPRLQIDQLNSDPDRSSPPRIHSPPPKPTRSNHRTSPLASDFLNGRLIDQNIEQGRYLGSLIEAEPALELIVPTTINIVCFRYRPPGADQAALKALNTEIMLRLQESGIAVVSDTTVHHEHCLRVATNNHRTKREDLQLLVRETIRIGQQIGNEGTFVV